MHAEIKFSGTSLAKYAQTIEALGDKAQEEMARGLNDGGKLVTTQVRRALQDQTSAKTYAVIVKNTSGIPAQVGDLRYRIQANRGGLPISDFKTRVIRGPGGGIQATVWGVDKQFQRSFALPSGRMVARVGDAREPVRRLYGPSLAKEMVKGHTLETFIAATNILVVPSISARLSRLMP